MAVWDEGRARERREANQRSGERRRIEEERRGWDRRHSAKERTDEHDFDRRGAHPSLFAARGFRLLRGVRRMSSARRGAVRRSLRRRLDDRLAE